MTFEIEKGVHFPTRKKYPFGEMNVGDSFLINGKTNPELVRTAAQSFGRARNWKFAVRKTDEGVRIWRVK